MMECECRRCCHTGHRTARMHRPFRWSWTLEGGERLGMIAKGGNGAPRDDR